ncbi:hypothetical protein N665_0914s0018, partial [Sinapis alba]
RENECTRCGALFWYNERIGRNRRTKTSNFTMCCLRGEIRLHVLKEPSAYLHGLLTNDDGLSRHFQDNIRAINMMFSFTSLRRKIDNSINRGKGPKNFKLHGENYHLIRSVIPNPNEPAKFSQLYIHDTANEVQNRIATLRKLPYNLKFTSGNSDNSKIRAELVESIMEMLRVTNVHVKTFQNAIDRFNSESECEDVKLILIHNRQKDGRVYNLPTSSEVAALVVGDFQLNMDKRDIVLEKYSGKLKRITELHPCYLPLQYPLIFPYKEDGFRLGIQNGFTRINKKKKTTISMREFFAYQIQIRHVGSQVLLFSRRLLQQLLVDAYTIIESHQEMEPRLYDTVKDSMIHGPCGVVNKDSPCMNDGRSTQFFPRKNVEKTTVDSQGYPIYRRREDGCFKKGIQLDNGYVVPYNKTLMLRYNAHINIEWCNQSRSLRYLFKYINKGSDCVTTTVTQKTTKNSTTAEGNQNSIEGVGGNTRVEGVHTATAGEGKEPLVDEIKKYFNARYVC